MIRKCSRTEQCFFNMQLCSIGKHFKPPIPGHAWAVPTADDGDEGGGVEAMEEEDKVEENMQELTAGLHHGTQLLDGVVDNGARTNDRHNPARRTRKCAVCASTYAVRWHDSGTRCDLCWESNTAAVGVKGKRKTKYLSCGLGGGAAVVLARRPGE